MFKNYIVFSIKIPVCFFSQGSAADLQLKESRDCNVGRKTLDLINLIALVLTVFKGELCNFLVNKKSYVYVQVFYFTKMPCANP